MIKDVALWERWEAQAVLSQPADFQKNLRLLEAMWVVSGFPPPPPRG